MYRCKNMRSIKQKLGDSEITELMSFDDWEKNVDEYVKGLEKNKPEKRRKRQ